MEEKYGKMIAKRFPSNTPLSIGNDMKAAASDALKKCAQALGIAQDVYNPENFKAANVKSDDEMHQDLEYEFEQHKTELKEATVKNVTRILTNKETSNYTKAWKQIQSEISK
jgi:hypothetical protein